MTIRELRNNGGVVIDRVQAGEVITVTRDGRPVAELRPIRPRGVPTALLLERRRHMPLIDAEQLRRDIDGLIDPSL